MDSSSRVVSNRYCHLYEMVRSSGVNELVISGIQPGPWMWFGSENPGILASFAIAGTITGT